jgi:hypothetical protein
MKDNVKQATSVLLAALLLFSTLSFHVDLHFCGDSLVDLSFTTKASTCGMETDSSALSGGCEMAAMDCCTDEAIVLQGQDDLQTCPADQLLHDSTGFIATTPGGPYPQVFQLVAEASRHFIDSSPPPLIRKIHILHQTFLI